MNLYDVVRRRDATLHVVDGAAQAVEPKLPAGTQRAVLMEPGTVLRLGGSHAITALRTFPSDIGWEVMLEEDGEFEVALACAGGEQALARLAGPGRHPLRLVWPLPVPLAFDLLVRARGASCRVLVGPLANVRTRIMPRLQGDGVEIGPGANPAVLPAPGRTVRYIEQKSRDEWASTYGKGTLQPSAAAHWDHYVVDSAHHLGRFERESIDFVFSSHVLEHLVNPLGVFSNWWQRLAPGGVIAGVVPDARFTFDFRQPLSTAEDFLAQARAANFDTTDAMYERWCRHTAPYNTIADLKARGYSIHVNYFSVENFRLLIDLFGESHRISHLYLESVRNGKDFAFMIGKP